MKDYFSVRENKTTVKIEILAGITTFLAMMYIIVVNPAVLSSTGMSFSAVLTATVLISAFSSIAMGLYANNPIALAPGMGLNAFFAFSVVNGMGVSWPVALGAVFWSGVIFLLLSVFNIRTLIVRSIPRPLRFAIAVGIGLFIAVIGLFNAKFVSVADAGILSRGAFTPSLLTFIAGLGVTSVLMVKRINGALIIGILFTTLLAIPIGRLWGEAPVVQWNGFFSAPDFSLLFALDLVHSLRLSLFPVVFAFVFTDMFDSLSTFIGVAEAGNLMDEKGEPRNLKQSLIVDALSTTIAGLLGSSAGTSYIESAAGIEEGGRTGLTAVVAGLLFLPFMFFSPLLSTIPQIATAPALVLVGVFMMQPIKKINWDKLDDAVPAFLAMILIPMTYSITQGIIWGFLSWTLIKWISGKKEEISPMLLIVDVFCILALVV
ncbi:MAG TPA: NCS2 family permease [Caldithrix abyssi]|uniref:NCS2 family permease n=1 Tax=Caldithrix abyssi TaxID=187145 RepID=A0A7V4TZ66_CALAY|nr:NCS2 family permease [Caldithrix abyssi]